MIGLGTIGIQVVSGIFIAFPAWSPTGAGNIVAFDFGIRTTLACYRKTDGVITAGIVCMKGVLSTGSMPVTEIP